MVKIYGMPGKVSAAINIPFNAGRGNLVVEFSRGCIDRKYYRPATYRSISEVEQSIIESSPYFGKSIILIQTIGNPESQEQGTELPDSSVDEVQVAHAPAREIVEHPEVTTLDGAVAVLKAIPGVKAAQLRSIVSIKRVAATYGISFPNYKFE